MRKKWKKYEEDIHSILKRNYSTSEITYDDSIWGLYSRTERQIDIVIRDEIAGERILGIVDCKYYNKNIDVKVVESFIGMIEDVNANFGMMITNKGYSQAAKNRVKYSNLKLDIFQFNELGEIDISVDYFLNMNIKNLQLSKSEFFRRNTQNTIYFDSNKSDYYKRRMVYKEGFAHTERSAQKKLLDYCTRAFRDFSQLEHISLFIPAHKNNEQTNFKDEKYLFSCYITRNELELFLKSNIENFSENIVNWRNDFLSKLDNEKIKEFAEEFIHIRRYTDYEKLTFK